MTVLSVIEWMLTSNTIVTALILLMFIFGLLIKLMRGKS